MSKQRENSRADKRKQGGDISVDPVGTVSDLCHRDYRGAVYRESTQNAAQANVGRLWADNACNENAWMIQKNVGLREVSLLRASIAFGSPHSGPPNAAGRENPNPLRRAVAPNCASA